MISDILRDAEKTYPEDWIEEAMKIAVEGNKRSWRYVEAILKRWVSEGKSPPSQTVEAIEHDPYLQNDYFRRRKNDQEDAQ